MGALLVWRGPIRSAQLGGGNNKRGQLGGKPGRIGPQLGGGI